jgi:hypothetical protein
MSKRLYVGKKRDGFRELFWSDFVPTYESHGNKYKYAIGPFRTKRGAEFMRDYGEGNPHCRSTNEAEKLAKLLAEGKLST